MRNRTAKPQAQSQPIGKRPNNPNQHKQMDSSVTITYSLKARVTLTMPDSELVPFLAGGVDLQPCLSIEMDNLPEGFEDCEINLDRHLQPMAIDCITRGDLEEPYDWDGSKLIDF